MTPVTPMFVLLKLQSVATVWFTGNLCSYTAVSLAAVSGGELNDMFFFFVCFVVVVVVARFFFRKMQGLEKLLNCLRIRLILLVFCYVDH